MKKALFFSVIVSISLFVAFLFVFSQTEETAVAVPLVCENCSSLDSSLRVEKCPTTEGWTKIDSGDLSQYPVEGATQYCFKAGPYVTYEIPEGGFGQEGACTEDHIERCALSNWSYYIPPITPTPTDITPTPTDITPTPTDITPTPTGITPTPTDITPTPTDITPTPTDITPTPTDITPTPTDITPTPTDITPTPTDITPTPTDITPTITEPAIEDGDYGINEGFDTKYFQSSELPESYIIEVKIESPKFNSWYDSYFKNELLIIRPECAPECTASQIETALEFTFKQDKYWVAVEVGRVLYTHSGWPINGLPYFGEPFKRALENGYEIDLVLGDQNYHATEYTPLTESVFLNTIFDNIQNNEKFLVYCGSNSTLITRFTP